MPLTDTALAAPATPPEPSDATRQALALFVKLMRAQRAVMAAAEPSILAAGLTVTQFGVLEALFHKGKLSHGELQRKVLTSPANLTDVIDKLAGRGLVARCRADDDARRVGVSLTDAGRALIAKAFPPHAAAIHDAMAVLSAEEQAQLTWLLRKLGLALEPGAAKYFDIELYPRGRGHRS